MQHGQTEISVDDVIKMSPMVDKTIAELSTSAFKTKYLSLTPHVKSLLCIHVGDQEGLCLCTLEQNRPYQCLVQVYFGAANEITAIL